MLSYWKGTKAEEFFSRERLWIKGISGVLLAIMSLFFAIGGWNRLGE